MLRKSKLKKLNTRNNAIFGNNEIVGKSYFKDAEKEQLLVTSAFFSLQGEGPFRGEPAFFIRLAKCNLACTFCDTFFDDGDWMTFDQIEELIENSIEDFYQKKNITRPSWTKSEIIETEDTNGSEQHPVIHKSQTKRKMVLVVTGGEPTLQANLGPFLEKLSDQFQHMQIESNGIVHQPSIRTTHSDQFDNSGATTLVISPKCAEKSGVAVKYLRPHKQNLTVAACLKFVMSSDMSSAYSTIPEWAHTWASETGRQIFISPMNIYNEIPAKSKEMRNTNNKIEMKERSTVDEVISFWTPGLLNMAENQKNHEYAAQYCITHGFVFNVQMHLLASLA